MDRQLTGHTNSEPHPEVGQDHHGYSGATAPQPEIHVLVQAWGGLGISHFDDDGGHEVEVGSGGSSWAQSSIWHLASAGVATLESFDPYFMISRSLQMRISR